MVRMTAEKVILLSRQRSAVAPLRGAYLPLALGLGARKNTIRKQYSDFDGCHMSNASKNKGR